MVINLLNEQVSAGRGTDNGKLSTSVIVISVMQVNMQMSHSMHLSVMLFATISSHNRCLFRVINGVYMTDIISWCCM